MGSEWEGVGHRGGDRRRLFSVLRSSGQCNVGPEHQRNSLEPLSASSVSLGPVAERPSRHGEAPAWWTLSPESQIPR